MTAEQQQTDFCRPQAAGTRRDGALKSRFSAALHKKRLFFFFRGRRGVGGGSVTRSIESAGNGAYAPRLAAGFNRLEDLKRCQESVCNGQEKRGN